MSLRGRVSRVTRGIRRRVSTSRSWLRGLAEYYYHTYSRTREHGISIAIATVLGLLIAVHPGFAIIAALVYFGLPIYFYATDPDIPTIDSPELDSTRPARNDTPLISVDLVPTVAGSDTPPDTRGMRNAEVRFNDNKATVHASVNLENQCDGYCLRFEAPDPPVETELRGAPLAEQTFEAPNILRCDDVHTYGFDPIIDMYVDNTADLDAGDYTLRVYEERQDELLAEIRLVSS